MESTRLEEENIIKDIRNLFRLKKEQNYTVIKDTRNLFTLEKKKLKQLKIEKKIIINISLSISIQILKIPLSMKKTK